MCTKRRAFCMLPQGPGERCGCTGCLDQILDCRGTQKSQTTQRMPSKSSQELELHPDPTSQRHRRPFVWAWKGQGRWRAWMTGLEWRGRLSHDPKLAVKTGWVGEKARGSSREIQFSPTSEILAQHAGCYPVKTSQRHIFRLGRAKINTSICKGGDWSPRHSCLMEW